MSSPPTLFVYLVLIINYLSSVMGQFIYCNNADECIGNQLVVTGSDEIWARGYKSVFGMNTSISGEDVVYCYGAYACTETSFIIGKYISCSGASSCANIMHPSKIHGETYVVCNGANACQNSNIISNGIVYCLGDQSCSHSNITSPTVYASGAYSLYGSTIKSDNIYLRGYQTGFGAYVKWKPNNTCNIYCYYNG
eukprot:177500_1